MIQKEQLTKKELYKIKQEEKKNRKTKADKRPSGVVKKLLMATPLLVLIGYGLNFLVQRSLPQGEDFSMSVPIMEDLSHRPPGSLDDFEYNSNPPTSGPHYTQTAQSGFRNEEIADGHLIHNLEHGDIWISFHPSIPESVQDSLRQFAGPKVIITPRSKNETDIALAAWGRLDIFDLENEEIPAQRIEDFIRRFMYLGPEQVPGASGGV